MELYTLDKDKYYKMLDMQDKILSIYIGNNYRDMWISTKTNKKADIELGLITELTELLNLLPWKWWDTKVNTNRNKVLGELADCTSFILSIIIKDTKYKTRLVRDVDLYIPEFKFSNVFRTYLYQDHIRIAINNIKQCILLADRVIVAKEFFSMLSSLYLALNISIEDIYNTYMLKANLNIFRANNGILDGKYTKIWNNKEDTEIAIEIFNKVKDIDIVYKELEKEYNLIKK